MKFLKYIFCALLFVTASVADTININWINGDETYAQTTCEIGGDIILPSPPTKRGYTFKGWLAEYTLLEYIESTGTQYINTGVSCKSNNIVYDFTVIDNNFGHGGSLFGSQTPSFSGVFYNNHGDILLYAGTSSALRIGYPSLSTNKKHHVLILNNGNAELKTNNTIVGTNTYSGTVVNKRNIYLFDNNNGQNERSSYRLIDWKMYDNGVLVRNFIPVKRNSDGVIGMYDTVSQTFFTNAGTGEFIAGPAAENQNL